MSTLESEAAPAPAATDVLPSVLAVLPIRDVVVFPFMVVPLFVSRPISIAAVEHAERGDGLVLLCTQRSARADLTDASELYRVGTLGKLVRVRRSADGQLKVIVQGLQRARIDEVERDGDAMRARYTALAEPTQAELSPERRRALEAATAVLKQGLSQLVDAGKVLPDEVLSVLRGLEDPGALGDLLAANLGLKVPDAQAVLECVNLEERLAQVQGCLRQEVEVLELKHRIQAQAKEEMSRTQREYFLREQLKQIRRELGDTGARESDLDDLRQRLEEAGLPPDVRREADKQRQRLEQLPPDASEASLVRAHLDWLAELPWARETPDRVELARARQILDEDHHGLDRIKERLLDYLSVMRLRGDVRGPVLCFIGPPGVGKTTLGRSIARALGRAFVRISFGGVRDEAEVRGHRRTYVGAQPGRIVAALKQAGTRNPVIVLDEVDKLGADGRGDPAAALLEVLDAEQNKAFRDHYLGVPVDLSRVLWVATANLPDAIPAPLRDRMEMVAVPGYPLDEKVEIVRRFLLPRQREAAGLGPTDLTLNRATIEALIESYTLEAGVRELDRLVAALARKVARRFAEGGRALRISPPTLAKLLGPGRPHERAHANDAVGVAIGLAWTEAGGAILEVEVSAMRGAPQLTLTGQLGKVMKESAQAALSYARSSAELLGVDERAFVDREFHVHVPQGAIPKDGPSAGITMATALVSMLTGHPVRHTVAMTGELTLRGRVLPVGGIREKLLAAARAGLTDVIVPEANAPELAELPEAQRARLRIHRVRHVEEVLAIALVDWSPRAVSARGPLPVTTPPQLHAVEVPPPEPRASAEVHAQGSAADVAVPGPGTATGPSAASGPSAAPRGR